MTDFADLEKAHEAGYPAARARWIDLDGPRTAYTHGPEQLPLGPTGTLLGPLYRTSEEAAEDARAWASLHRANRVVYKLVPVSWHRSVTGKVE